MKRLGSILCCSMAVACAIPAGLASAAAIPGATYKGVLPGGAVVTFNVSSDGTLLTSYSITGVVGSSCALNAFGASGSFPGAPITNNSFSYAFFNDVSFRGTFSGTQSASGTLKLHNNAVLTQKACSSPTISWRATTTSTPPAGVGSGGGTGGGGTGGGGGSTGHGAGSSGGGARDIATRVSIRKLSRKWVGGHVRSSMGACVAGRKVTLWRGTHRLSSTRAKRNGSFAFKRSVKVRGHRVRATVAARSVSSAVCEAGSSTFVRL